MHTLGTGFIIQFEETMLLTLTFRQLYNGKNIIKTIQANHLTWDLANVSKTILEYQMTQNQAMTDPIARPTTRNKTITMPAVSACCI